MSVKHLISPVFINILFSSGATDFLIVVVFLNVFGVCSTDGKISSALLLKIRTRLVSHSNVVRNICFNYFSSKYFEYVPECFADIRCWWFTKCIHFSFKCGLESGKQKPASNQFNNK